MTSVLYLEYFFTYIKTEILKQNTICPNYFNIGIPQGYVLSPLPLIDQCVMGRRINYIHHNEEFIRVVDVLPLDASTCRFDPRYKLAISVLTIILTTN